MEEVEKSLENVTDESHAAVFFKTHSRICSSFVALLHTVPSEGAAPQCSVVFSSAFVLRDRLQAMAHSSASGLLTNIARDLKADKTSTC